MEWSGQGTYPSIKGDNIGSLFILKAQLSIPVVSCKCGFPPITAAFCPPPFNHQASNSCHQINGGKPLVLPVSQICETPQLDGARFQLPTLMIHIRTTKLPMYMKLIRIKLYIR